MYTVGPLRPIMQRSHLVRVGVGVRGRVGVRVGVRVTVRVEVEVGVGVGVGARARAKARGRGRGRGRVLRGLAQVEVTEATAPERVASRDLLLALACK